MTADVEATLVQVELTGWIEAVPEEMVQGSLLSHSHQQF